MISYLKASEQLFSKNLIFLHIHLTPISFYQRAVSTSATLIIELMIYQVPDHSYCSQHHLQVYHGLQLKINRFPVTRRSLLSQTEVIFLATETHGSSCILHHFFNNKILKFLITHNLKKLSWQKKYRYVMN